MKEILFSIDRFLCAGVLIYLLLVRVIYLALRLQPL